MSEKTVSKLFPIALVTVLTTVFAAECVMNLTPPISRDALIHHLAIPKLWLKHGGFYEIPWAKYSYYPMNIDLLYLAALYLGNDVAPKFIHWAFGLGTAFLVYTYIKPRLGTAWGLLAVTIFATTPIIVRLSTCAYVDLGLCFFLTAGVLSFVAWRNGLYQQPKWLVVSAACTGLALGCKYNALVGAAFLNLMVVYYYAKDTKKQTRAVLAGLAFFALSAFVASPWYMKNWLLTGNPFYPLFRGVFGAADNHHSATALMTQTGSGLFEKRHLMFGETFTETLLIPIRMFFEGRDDAYRYFDGVLNPVLILFLPFSFIYRQAGKDRLLFLSFSLFAILSTFFLTRQQVRYMVFALPFLSILAVMGIKSLFCWILLPALQNPSKDKKRRLYRPHTALRATAGAILSAGIAMLLVPNVTYLKNRFDSLDPIGFIRTGQNRKEFLRRHLASYPAIEFINAQAPSTAKVLMMFVGNRGYYLDRPYVHDRNFGMETLGRLVASSRDDKAFRSGLESLDCRYVLVRDDLFGKYLADNFDQARLRRFLDLKNRYWSPVYHSRGFTVYDLKLA
ncbi:MAG: phospholipid carrier-dependent glycosyltransferase [Deltaproteobacteria bacterium]|nr:phospholipid carrier-dependent glycosyltransferase [Deltaproteobacteria bacterium]